MKGEKIMKKTKVVSVVLAVVMLFSVVSVSVFADTWTTSGSIGSFSCDGTLTMRSSYASTEAYAYNNSLSAQTIRVNTQCVVEYDDGDIDIDFTSYGDESVPKKGSTSASAYVAMEKVVSAVYAEFYFLMNGEDETLGIDIERGTDF